MRQEERRQRQPLEADVELLRALLEVHRRSELAAQVRELAETAKRWSGAAEARAWALDAEGARLVPVARASPAGGARASGSLPVETVGRGLGAGAALGPGRRPDWLAVPVGEPCALWAVRAPGGELVGLVTLGGLDPRGYESARTRLEALFEGSRPAAAQALLLRATRELVIKDDTADCFNRRYFNEFLQSEMARATRFRSPLSLIFFDLDDLKSVNTRYGHATGSKVLLEVSRRVQTRIRRFDKLFRFGGDEFCIVLPETEWHGALEVGERVREVIGGTPMLRDELGPEGLPMTASFGIASFPLHARDLRELIERADWAMQEAKSRGKNSIAVADVIRPPRAPAQAPMAAEGSAGGDREGGR